MSAKLRNDDVPIVSECKCDWIPTATVVEAVADPVDDLESVARALAEELEA